MGQRPPTIRDVAREAGVGTTTVSRVINGGNKVGATTAARVQDVIRTLGYRPNRLANSFRAGSLGMIGMIVPDPAQTIYQAISYAVDDRAAHLRMVVTTAGSRRDSERERALVRSFMQRGADGILVATEDDDHSYLETQLAHGYPMVYLLDPPRGVSAHSVVGDDLLGGELAVRHLHAHGHTRIGIIGSESKPSMRLRADGYRAAINSLSIEFDPELIEMRDPTVEAGFTAAQRLLRRPNPPTALFSTNQSMTMGVVKAVQIHPRPVALVCYGDFEGAALLNPGLTVIKSDPEQIGLHAAELLLNQLEGQRMVAKQIVVPAILTERGSGEIPPAA